LTDLTKFGTLTQNGYLSTAIVKKFQFHKSNMADGGHFENLYIILSLQPFD